MLTPALTFGLTETALFLLAAIAMLKFAYTERPTRIDFARVTSVLTLVAIGLIALPNMVTPHEPSAPSSTISQK